jgi:hypothetical protein
MEPLHQLLPELAEESDRTLSAGGRGAARYLLVEGHCAEPGCDCRRVRLVILSERTEAPVTAFDYDLPPKGGNESAPRLVPAVGFPKASNAKLLPLVKEALAAPEYAARLAEHYEKVRAALRDPKHPIHARLLRHRAWLGARVSLPTYIVESSPGRAIPEPYRPDVVLWVDGESGMILAQDLVPPDESAGALAAALKKASAAAKVPPPPYLRVSDEAQAETLRRALGEGVTVEAGPLPELEPLLDSLRESIRGGPEPTYLGGGRIAPEVMARLFRAATRLYRVAPWEFMTDADSPALDIPALGVSGVAYSVMGLAGQSFGFLLFENAADALTFRAFAERHEPDEGEPIDDETPGVRFLTLELVSGAELTPEMRREIKRHRWEVAGPRAYPELRWLDPDMAVRPYGEREVALLTAAAEALAAFTSRHKRELSARDPFTVTETIESEELPGRPAVTLTWPHPKLPAPPASEDDGGSLSAGAQQELEVFLAAQAARGEEWCGFAEWLLTELYGFLADEAGISPERARAPQLEEFLLSYLPARVTLPDEDTARVPEVLLAFFDWLSSQGKLSAAAARVVRKKIESLRESSVAAANDPTRFGPAKAIALLAMRHGVELTDPRAVERFMKACNAGEIEGYQEAVGAALSRMGLPAPQAAKKVPRRSRKKPNSSPAK